MSNTASGVATKPSRLHGYNAFDGFVVFKFTEKLPTKFLPKLRLQ